MNFEVFLKGSKHSDIVKYVASNRYSDKGKPVEWEIKPISSDLDELIRKECTKKVPVNGKRGQYIQEIDNDKYVAKICTASTVYPNLKDAQFQDAMGVTNEEALLKKLLLPGEYTEYKAKVMEVNGYDLTVEDLIDDAKN